MFIGFVLFFVNLTEARVIWEEETLVEKMPPPTLNWPIGMSGGVFSILMIDVEGSRGRWS